jgi:hypothetical protein
MKDRFTLTSKDRDSVFAALQQVYLQLLRTCTRSYANYACMHNFLTRHRGGRNPPKRPVSYQRPLSCHSCVLIYFTAVLLVNGQSLLLQRFISSQAAGSLHGSYKSRIVRTWHGPLHNQEQTKRICSLNTAIFAVQNVTKNVATDRYKGTTGR